MTNYCHSFATQLAQNDYLVKYVCFVTTGRQTKYQQLVLLSNINNSTFISETLQKFKAQKITGLNNNQW